MQSAKCKMQSAKCPGIEPVLIQGAILHFAFCPLHFAFPNAIPLVGRLPIGPDCK
jgi:hypothetical protein